MKISGSLSSPARSAARWSRRLGLVVFVGAAGVAATPAQSFAPAASFAVSHQQDRGTAPARTQVDALVQASSTPALAGPSVVDDVPAPALRAYRFAAAVLARTDAQCGLDWSLLAAIGDVESDHGRYGNAVLHPDGTSTPSILGPQLDGAGDVAAIADTDDGSLDADERWDRAVGPMQFIPSTWAVVGSDADGDGARDPHDLDDAALSAAAYLCAGPADLSTVDGQRSAVYRYNPSHAYVRLVLRLAAAYADQPVEGLELPMPGPQDAALRVPTPAAPIERPVHPEAPPRQSFSDTAPALRPTGAATRQGSDRGSSQGQQVGSGGPAADSTTGGGTGGANRPGPGGGSSRGGDANRPDAGNGGAAPTADPAPSTPPDDGSADGGATGGGTPADGGSSGGATPPPRPPVSGALQRADDGTWSVGGTTVDFGDDAYLSSTALNDFDGADGVESNLGELETLVGHDVTANVEESSQVVLRLNDLAYR